MSMLSIITELTDFGIRPELIQDGNEQLGSDIAMPCFALAKEYKKAPQAIAEEIASTISHNSVAKAEAVAGYVNIWLEPKYILGQLAEHNISQPNYGDKLPNDSTVIIDFVAPNLAKPLSVGHLRNVFQGRGLTNLYRSQGYTVVTDNHLGDWGTTFGMWVIGYQKFGVEEQLLSEGNKELGRVYIEMRKALKEEEASGGDALKQKVQEWLIKLESGDEEAWAYHAKFKKVSLDDTARILTQLDVVFDENLGEAFYYEQARDLLQELVDNGTAVQQDDGSIIVPLNDQGIETPLLLQKSNGATLYATSDIATIKYREERWDPATIIYVVGAEQQFHFKQLFAFNDIVKYSDAELVHHWYGLVEETNEDGGRQKMSSRTGAVYLEDILTTARAKAQAQAKEGMTEEDVERIALGALTFREFLQGHKSNVLFDWDDMFSLTGKSGPYVQYAAVRLSSILDKSGVTEFEADAQYDWSAEHKLLGLLSKYPGVLESSLHERELNKIAFYVYDLARELNRYYEDTKVLADDPSIRSSRLWLMHVIRMHISHALGILGIKIPESM